MADEEKYDIPDFSHIEDRVERAKAKAAAIRAAKGKGDGSVPVPAAAPAVAKAAEAPAVPPPEAEPAGGGEAGDFSHITDRVARAKAKAAAMRAAKGGGAAPAVPAPAAAPAAPAAAEDRVARAKAKAEAARAAKGVGGTAPTAAPAAAKAAEAPAAPPKVERKVKTGPTTPPPEFRPGVVLRINGKNALIIAGRKSRFVLVYEQDPIEQRIPVDRVRLEREWFLGNLEVVSVGPPPVEKTSPKKILAYAAAAGVTGVFFAVTGYLLGPLGLFLVIPAAYFLFGLASRVPDVEF